MKEPKRLTERALKTKREAYWHRQNGKSKGSSASLDKRLSDTCEAEAEAILKIHDDELPVTAMGEVTHPHIAGLPRNSHSYFRESLNDSGMVQEEASITRTDLLLQDNMDISALAVDTAYTIKAENSLEKMLAHQLALNHELTMKLGDAALGQLRGVWHTKNKSFDVVDLQRYVNCIARLQASYQQGMLTIQKIRTGGAQTVTVQHVNVGAGGQAVIGNVQAGGGKPEGESAKNG